MAMGSGKAIRNMAHDLLNKHECEILKAALKHFRATKSVPFLCTSLMQVINTPQKMVLLEEISNMLPESLRGDFTNICSMNFKDYTNEIGANGDETKVIAQDPTGQYKVVESDHRKDLIKPGENPNNNFGKSNITGGDLRLQPPPGPKAKKSNESGSTETLQDENQNNQNPDKNIEKQKQRLTLPLSKEDGTHTPSSVGTCRTEDLNDYVDKHLGVIYEREFETSPLPGEVTSSTDIGEMYGLQKKDSSLPRRKKGKKDAEGSGEKGAKAKGRRMPRQDSGDSSTTGASKPLSRPQSRGSLLSTGHSSKGLKKKASKLSLDSRESLDSRDQYLMEVQSKNDDNVVGSLEMNSLSPLRSRQVLDTLPHEASDKSIQVLLDPAADPRNLHCESTQTSPSISRENSMHQMPVGKGRRKTRSTQTQKGERAASAPPGDRAEKGAKAPKKAKDKSNHPKSGSRPPSSTMTRSSSMAHSLAGRSGVDIRKVKLTRQESADLGFSIRGGRDVRSGVYISEVDSSSQAEKQGLQIGDRILKVNDTSFRSITHDEAAYTIKTAGRIVMYVTSSLMHKMPIRSAPPSMKGQRAIENLKSMTVKADPDGWLGCSIRGGTDYGMSPMVSNVDPGSPAEKVGLKNGDLVVRMNGVDVTSLTHMQIVTLATSAHELRLLIKPIEQPQQLDEAREPLEDLSAHESTPTPTLQLHQESSPSPVARKAPAQLPPPEKSDTGKSPRGKRKQKKSDKKYASMDAINTNHHEHPDLAIAKNDENEPPSIRLVNATPLIDRKSVEKPTEEGGATKNKEHEEEKKKEKRKSRSRQNLASDEKVEKREKGDKVKKRDRLKVDGEDQSLRSQSLDRRKQRKEREEKKAKIDGTKSLDRREMEQISKGLKEEKEKEKKERRRESKESKESRRKESKEEKQRESTHKEEKEKTAEEVRPKEAAKAKETKEAEPAPTKQLESKKDEKNPHEHRRKKSAEWVRTETFDEPTVQDDGPSDRSTPIMKQIEHPEELRDMSPPVERKMSPPEQKPVPEKKEAAHPVEHKEHAKEKKGSNHHAEKKPSVENEPAHKKDEHKKGRKEQKLNEKNLEKNEKVAKSESREERHEDHKEPAVQQNGQHVVENNENHSKHHDKKKGKHEKAAEKVHREKSHEKPHIEDEKPAETIPKDYTPVKPNKPLEIKEEEIQMSIASEVANGNTDHHHHRGRKERQSSKEERDSRRKKTKTPTSEVDSGLPPSMEDLADEKDSHKLIRRMTQEDSWSDNNASFDREDFDPGSLNRKRRTSVSSQTTQSTQTDISGEIKVTKVMSGTIRMNLDQQQSLDDPTKTVLSPKEHVKNIFPMDAKYSEYDHLHHDEGAQTYMYGSIEGLNEINQDSASVEDAPQRSSRHAPFKKLSRAGSDASLMKKKQHGVSLKHKAPSVSNLMLESTRQRPSRYDDYNISDYPPPPRDLRFMDYYEPRVRSLPRGMPGVTRRDGNYTLPRNYSFTRGIPDDYEERYYMTHDPHSVYSISSAKDHTEVVRGKLPRDVHSEYSIRTARDQDYDPEREHGWCDDNVEPNWRVPADKEKNMPHGADVPGYESDHVTRRYRERDDSGSRSVSGERGERRYCDRDYDPMRAGHYQEKEYRRSYPDQEYSRRQYIERDNSRDRRYSDRYYDRDLPVKDFIEKPREYREKSREREQDRSREREGDKNRDRELNEKTREQDFEKREREYFEYNRDQEMKKKIEQKIIGRADKGHDRDYPSKAHKQDSTQDRKFPEKRGEGDHMDKTLERDPHHEHRERMHPDKNHEQEAYGDKHRERDRYADRERQMYGPPGYRWNPDYDAAYEKHPHPEYARRDSLPRENPYDRPYLTQKHRERSFDLGIERERSFGAMSFGGYEHEEKRDRNYSGSPAYRPGYGERPLSSRSEPEYHPYQERIIPGRQGIYLPDPDQGPAPGPSANRPYLDPTFLRPAQRLAPPFNIEQPNTVSRESLGPDNENEHLDSRLNLSSSYGAEQSQPQQPTKEKPPLYQQTVGSLEGQGIRIQWKKPQREIEQFAIKSGPLPWHSQHQYSQDSDSSEKYGNPSYNFSGFSEPKSSMKKFDSSSPRENDREEFQNSAELSFSRNPLDFSSSASGVNLLSGFRGAQATPNVLIEEKANNNLSHNDGFINNDFGAKAKDNGFRYPADDFDTMGDETDQMTISSLPPDDHCEDGSEQDIGLPTGSDAKEPMQPLEELVIMENSVGLSCEPPVDLDAPLEKRPSKSPDLRPPHMRQTSEEEEWNM